MTQKALAAATGWTDRPGSKGLRDSRIANYEQGSRRIGQEEADIFASIFRDYPSAYFMGVVDEREAIMLQLMRQEKPDRAA